MNELTAHMVEVARQWFRAMALGQPEIAMELIDPGEIPFASLPLSQMIHSLYYFAEDDADWDLPEPPPDWVARLRTPGGVITALEEMPPVPIFGSPFTLPDEGDDEDVWVSCWVPVRGEWSECAVDFVGGYREDGTPYVALHEISR